MSRIVDLNVGGVSYTTSVDTLTKVPSSFLAKCFDSKPTLPKDSSGRYFIDRDGVLFRYILDYLRNGRIILPEHFSEKERLKMEAEYYELSDLARIVCLKSVGALSSISSLNPSTPFAKSPSITSVLDGAGCITIGYRGSFTFGRDGLADVKLRKVLRLLVYGKVALCRRVFGDTLNESRDTDRGDCDRYSARFFLKHNFLEQAFDMLLESGFRLKAACGSGTNTPPIESAQMNKMSIHNDTEEGKWYHYNEFVWVKDS